MHPVEYQSMLRTLRERRYNAMTNELHHPEVEERRIARIRRLAYETAILDLEGVWKHYHPEPSLSKDVVDRPSNTKT